jgi:hypothetical protein
MRGRKIIIMMEKNNIVIGNFNEFLQDINCFAVDSFGVVDQVTNNIPFGLIGVTKHIWNYHKERKMKRFLMGLALKLNERGGYDDEDRDKLKSFLSHDQSKEKFFGILDEALNSVSELSSEILGYFAGEILLSSHKLDYYSSVIIHALRNMNDWDIKYFNKAYNFLISLPEDHASKGVNATSLYLALTPEEFEKSNDDIENMIYTDEKLIEFRSSLLKMSNLQVINTGGIIFSADSNTFVRSRVGDKLNDLINIFYLVSSEE